MLVDHERKTVQSIFEETVENKLERDLDNIMKDENILKKYKPEHLKIEQDKDGYGRPLEKKIEGFVTQKYTFHSVYTMTKYKQNLISLRSGIEQLKKITNFDEYLAFGGNELHD